MSPEDISIYLGNIEEAERHCAIAEQIIEEVGAADITGWYYRVKGMMLAERGERDKALDAFRKSIEVLENAGMIAEVAKTYYCMGLKLGAEYREMVERARDIFTERGMEHWREKATSLTLLMRRGNVVSSGRWLEG